MRCSGHVPPGGGDRWGYISWLAWECFVVPLDGLEEMVMTEDTSDINFVNCGPN